jgi:hypothetical protein
MIHQEVHAGSRRQRTLTPHIAPPVIEAHGWADPPAATGDE